MPRLCRVRRCSNPVRAGLCASAGRLALEQLRGHVGLARRDRPSSASERRRWLTSANDAESARERFSQFVSRRTCEARLTRPRRTCPGVWPRASPRGLAEAVRARRSARRGGGRAARPAGRRRSGSRPRSARRGRRRGPGSRTRPRVPPTRRARRSARGRAASAARNVTRVDVVLDSSQPGVTQAEAGHDLVRPPGEHLEHPLGVAALAGLPRPSPSSTTAVSTPSTGRSPASRRDRARLPGACRGRARPASASGGRARRSRARRPRTGSRAARGSRAAAGDVDASRSGAKACALSALARLPDLLGAASCRAQSAVTKS